MESCCFSSTKKISFKTTTTTQKKRGEEKNFPFSLNEPRTRVCGIGGDRSALESGVSRRPASLSLFFFILFAFRPCYFLVVAFVFFLGDARFHSSNQLIGNLKITKKLAGATDELRKQNNKTVRTYTSINACWEIKKQKGWNDYETLIIYLQFDKRRVKDNASAPYWYYIVFLFVSVWKKKKEKKKIDYSTKRPYGL